MTGLVRGTVSGGVRRVIGTEVECAGLRLAVGDAVDVLTREGPRPAEVIAVQDGAASALVLGSTTGIARGDRVRPRTGPLTSPVGPALLGRVVDALGRPLDGRGPILAPAVPVDAPAPPALARRRIDAPLATGVRLLDTLCTVGRGQRLGLFAGSGVGKSTLLSMMVRGTDADISVIALVGERGREVREFIEDVLGPEGLARSVVVVATSDEPALLRLRAATYATRIAEGFADTGADVLLTVDSLTRLATAQREVGLAAGEPPTSRGYPPSVFALLPRLLERAGPRVHGTITAFYTILVEGGDHDEPVADAARSILDGHVVLDRQLTTMGRFPAVDPLASLSRLATTVTSPEQIADATTVRRALAAAARVKDLVEVGAYAAGADRAADAALALEEATVAFLSQAADDRADYDASWSELSALAAALRQLESGVAA
ncbi:FliI/YscN family ATPase [Nitriliruptor alkaliphilus]|uniref:FliI/YscN family ATPase n=1 Tax=Nitriliruptor alkaliphilus TaxID=427918 RepID=UPI0006986BAE|nr:FliI/YscN family ATPase [Nitriliruptor alkaliphilus]